MIDITPLDVRKKRGDFKKSMRGYEPQEVDTFLDLVAERMEQMVKETIGLRERAERLQAQVDAQVNRERAVQDALVTAQALREDMREQSRREAEVARREAEVEAKKLLADAERRLEERRGALEELERQRTRFLRAFRSLLERQLDVVVVEEGRSPLDEQAVDLDFTGGRVAAAEPEGEGNGITREAERAERPEGAGAPPSAGGAHQPSGGSAHQAPAGDAYPPPAGGAPQPSAVEASPPPAAGELWLSGLSDAPGEGRTGD